MKLDYSGERYADTVPDTLDLADRARMAAHGITGSIDPELLTMYGQVYYACARPHQCHWASAETTCDPKFGEALPMLRLMSGSGENLDLEERYLDAMLRRVQDGLYWDLYDPRRPWRNGYAPAFYGQGKDEDFAVVGATGIMMRALACWRQAGGDAARIDALLREMVAGMRRVAILKDDYAYYPEKGGWGEPCTYPRSGWLNTDEARSETEGGEGSITAYHGNQIYAAAKWYLRSGDHDALDLAARLTRFCMQPKFWGGVPDPDRERAKQAGLIGHVAACLPDPPYTAGAELGHWFSHFHARNVTLRGMLQYGIAAEDPRVLEFVRRAYEFSLTQGIPRIGWINCWPASAAQDNRCEGCALGDLVAFGIQLSDHGIGDYWDDVDAVVRNQLAEQQLTNAEALERISAHSTSWSTDDPALPGLKNYDNTIARTLGVFAGTAAPNAIPNPWVMHCCTGNGARGLYYAWEGTLREDHDTVRVNLLLNRAARLADVHSHLPHAGRVEIRNKGARRIHVRIPAWAGRRNVRAAVDGQPARPDWIGNGLVFCRLAGRESIVIEFPVQESAATYTVSANSPTETRFTCVFRGSTCVDVSPRDASPTSLPLYDRAALRAERAPLRQVERFVPCRLVSDW